MPITRVKICGITRPEDATLAAELGADAIGLNFVGGPRKISVEIAASILQIVPPMIEPVGLFKVDAFMHVASDEPLQQIEWSIETKQWYGDTSTLAAHRWGPSGAPWWYVFHVESREILETLSTFVSKLHFRPHAVMLDTGNSSVLGGTGQSFNWNWIAQAREAGELNGLPPIILAGGLTPDNVADAIRIAKPYAVDVSSGVEVPGKPGIKDPIKMRDFIQAAKQSGY